MRLRIALITPCCNEQATLGGLAASLDAQDSPQVAAALVAGYPTALTRREERVARDVVVLHPRAVRVRHLRRAVVR